MHQHVKTDFFLPFDPFINLFSQELIIVFCWQLALAESQAFGTDFLGLREGTNCRSWQWWQIECLVLNFLTLCKDRQASVVSICQASNPSSQLCILPNTLCCKKSFVSSKYFCTTAIADSIQVTDFIQFFHRKGKVVQDCWFKIFISCCKWHMEQWTWACQNKIFSWDLLKHCQALFIVVAPNVFTVDNPCIKSLVSREATFNKFKCFLTFNEVQTNRIYWQLYKVCIDVTNVTKVGLNQDFQAFLVCQKLLIKVQEESFFFCWQVFDQTWLIQLDTLCT